MSKVTPVTEERTGTVISLQRPWALPATSCPFPVQIVSRRGTILKCLSVRWFDGRRPAISSCPRHFLVSRSPTDSAKYSAVTFCSLTSLRISINNSELSLQSTLKRLRSSASYVVVKGFSKRCSASFTRAVRTLKANVEFKDRSIWPSLGDPFLGWASTHVIPRGAFLCKPTVVYSDRMFQMFPLSQAIAAYMDRWATGLSSLVANIHL